MRLRVIDLETSDLEPTAAEIVELAFIDIDERGRELARYQTLVRPFGKIDIEARAVHHITDHELAASPRWPQVAFHIRAAFPKPDVLIAHRSAFERQWLTEVWENVPWICTYKAGLRAWPDAPRHSNSVLRYWLGIDIPPDPLMPAHRALCDCTLPWNPITGEKS